MTIASESIDQGAPLVHFDGPIVLARYHGRTPDRYVIGFGGSRVAIYQPVGAAKPKEECQPFTFTLYAPRDQHDLKHQEKFTKGLATLEKKIIRERKARAKRVTA